MNYGSKGLSNKEINKWNYDSFLELEERKTNLLKYIQSFPDIYKKINMNGEGLLIPKKIEENDIINYNNLETLVKKFSIMISRKRKHKNLREKIIEKRNEIEEYNLGIVLKRASHYNVFLNRSFFDIFQDGCLGSQRAVEKFNYKKEYNFSTFAIYWIDQSIIRGYNNHAYTIRIPIHTITKIRKMEKLARKLDLDINNTYDLYIISKEMNMNIKEILKLREYNIKTSSLNKEITKEDSKIELGDIIEDKNIKNPFEIYESKKTKVDVLNLLKCLSPREEIIIKMRFGIKCLYSEDPPREYTLEEIGDYLNVTRERVRRIQYKALKKLRLNQEIEGITLHQQ